MSRKHHPQGIVNNRGASARSLIAVGAGIAAGMSLAASVSSIAAVLADPNAPQAAALGLTFNLEVPETQPSGMLQIVAPENANDLGIIFFGEGDRFVSPSALRGPR
jgi:hypothetical protein